jgi:hypothetical protein
VAEITASELGSKVIWNVVEPDVPIDKLGLVDTVKSADPEPEIDGLLESVNVLVPVLAIVKVLMMVPELAATEPKSVKSES